MENHTSRNFFQEFSWSSVSIIQRPGLTEDVEWDTDIFCKNCHQGPMSWERRPGSPGASANPVRIPCLGGKFPSIAVSYLEQLVWGGCKATTPPESTFGNTEENRKRRAEPERGKAKQTEQWKVINRPLPRNTGNEPWQRQQGVTRGERSPRLGTVRLRFVPGQGRNPVTGLVQTTVPSRSGAWHWPACLVSGSPSCTGGTWTWSCRSQWTWCAAWTSWSGWCGQLSWPPSQGCASSACVPVVCLFAV